jgi:hypothetical protein
MRYFKILITLMLLILPSCSTQRFIFNEKLADQVRNQDPSFKKQGHFILGGLFQRSRFNPKEMCAGIDQDLAMVDFIQTSQNISWGVVTLGVYTPREARIYCSLKGGV